MRHTALLLLACDAAGHSSMTLPHSRNGGTLEKAGGMSAGAAASWYTTPTTTSHRATLPAGFHTVTFPMGGKPWRAPGTALINSPCGQYGVVGVSGGGKDGKDLAPKKRDIWEAGGTATVAWAIYQNHGGGYAYRLCPVSEKLTEECFQQHHLAFADDTTTVRWTNGTEVKIPAKRATIDGKQWTMNPIPNDEGGAPFKAPCPGCTGGFNSFNMMDNVVVPNIAPGDYVVSWRWDCEVTTQVWANCGDITIKAGSGPAPAPKPATAYGCSNNECVPDVGGVPKETCVAACHS